jgi:glycosyltransferase involved in cell wall biosynthesis
MKISVCMATYNGEPYIKDQLSSIVPQLGPKDELIISDDNSTDNTIDIIKNFKDPRIKLFRNNFGSPIFNFEFALGMCEGDFIFLSDQDDLWEPDKVKTVSELLKKYDLVVTDCRVIDYQGAVTHDSFYDLRGSGKGLLKNFCKNSYLGCCMAMKRQIVKKSLPFPKRIPMHDIWIGMIGELFGSTFFCSQKLVKYRRHGGNKSFAAEISPYSLYRKGLWRGNLLVCLLSRYTTLKFGKKFKARPTV